MATWVLHIVAIQGEAGWRTGLVLCLVVLVVGGGFAYLTGEWRQPDGLSGDLLLAAAGAGAANAAAGQVGGDLLALIFGVRVFWASLGGLVTLCLVHDAIACWQQSSGRPDGNLFGMTGRGGFLYLTAWLSGWPTEPGLLEATYAGGLAIKLLPEALHYQVRAGPLRISRAVPLLRVVRATAEGSTLLLTTRPDRATKGSAAPPFSFAGVHPAGQALALQERIAQLAGQVEPSTRPESPPLR